MLRCALVSRAWRRVARNSLLWKQVCISPSLACVFCVYEPIKLRKQKHLQLKHSCVTLCKVIGARVPCSTDGPCARYVNLRWCVSCSAFHMAVCCISTHCGTYPSSKSFEFGCMCGKKARYCALVCVRYTACMYKGIVNAYVCVYVRVYNHKILISPCTLWFGADVLRSLATPSAVRSLPAAHRPREHSFFL